MSLLEQRLVSTGVSYAINDTSESDDDPFTTIRPSTQFRSHSHRSRPPRLPTRRTTTNDTNSSVTSYGTVHDTSTNPRSANFFVGSLSGATDNTNVSVQSINENSSDIETIDDEDGEAMHSVLISSESNPAYVNDEDDRC